MGATARQGRADGLRQALQRSLIRTVISELRSSTLDRKAQVELVTSAFNCLLHIDNYFRLNDVDLSDDHFDEGTVLDLWMREIHPYLTHRDPIFMEYEIALRAKNAAIIRRPTGACAGAACPIGRCFTCRAAVARTGPNDRTNEHSDQSSQKDVYGLLRGSSSSITAIIRRATIQWS